MPPSPPEVAPNAPDSVYSIFVSSLARGEMAAIRTAARQAIESLGMRPVMFETAPASAQNSRRVLLDDLSACDALILLLGAEYGEQGERGMSPTEEEFDHAVREGIPVIALVQEGVSREPAQEEFIKRVRGSWEQGRFAPTFRDAADVGFAVVKALNDWRSSAPAADRIQAAEARAVHLAEGRQSGGWPGGSKMRVVAVPAISRPLLDAVALTDAGDLLDDLAGAARTSRLVTNAMAIDASVEPDDTVRLQVKAAGMWEQLAMLVGSDGAVVAEGPVGGSGQFFGGMMVMHDRVLEVIERSLRFAELVWQRIDTRDEVQQVLVKTALPEAAQKVYALAEPGNRMTAGGLGKLPNILIVPQTPLVLRRQDLGRPETWERLRAELRRRFQAADAVNRA